MNAYAQMKIGSSLVRTTTAKSTKDPVWEETFSFNEDSNIRFAKIEIRCEVPLSATKNREYSVGMLEIPLMPIKESRLHRCWYKLGYSGEGNAVGFNGELEVEIHLVLDPKTTSSSSGTVVEPNEGVFLPFRRFFESVRQLQKVQPAYYIDHDSDDESDEGSPKSKEKSISTEPSVRFPPFDSEAPEDMHSAVALVSHGTDTPLFCLGCLILTNFRLIFLENKQTTTEVFAAINGLELTDLLSTGIPIHDIVECSITSKYIDFIKSSVEVMRIRYTALQQVFLCAFIC